MPVLLDLIQLDIDTAPFFLLYMLIREMSGHSMQPPTHIKGYDLVSMLPKFQKSFLHDIFRRLLMPGNMYGSTHQSVVMRLYDVIERRFINLEYFIVRHLYPGSLNFRSFSRLLMALNFLCSDG